MPDTIELVMQSIAADSLVVVTGAGLSMAPPSSLPSAYRVAEACAAAYAAETGGAVPADAQTDLEKMTQWFRGQGAFESLFLGKLVPWTRFNGRPNVGHETLADFLACGAIAASATTNYDCLVENSAAAIGEPDFQPISDVEGSTTRRAHRDYLKAHGCCSNWHARNRTIWCKDQLTDAALQERTGRFSTWLQENLAGKDLLIVGFWSDWAYLNEVFAGSLLPIKPNRVFVIDLATEDQLKAKAPQMWDWSHRTGISFHHEQVSGADFLDGLRQRFARVFLRKALADCRATYQDLFGTAPVGTGLDLPGKDSRLLYALRRDLTGVPSHRCVRLKDPHSSMQVCTALHVCLMDLGATYEGHIYRFNGSTIRLIASGGELLSRVKARYADEPPLTVDRTVCVGAIGDPSSPHIVRGGTPPSIIRGGPAPSWEPHDSLIEELRRATSARPTP